MPVSAQIEIAASPDVVRRIVLDFPNWDKFGDHVLRGVTAAPSSDPKILPGQKGSHVIVNYLGVKNVALLVTENTSEVFSWYANLFHMIEGTHYFRFLPSEKTPGYTTLVNEEVFGKLAWVMWKLGVDVRPGFEALCRGVKARVESVLEEERVAI